MTRLISYREFLGSRRGKVTRARPAWDLNVLAAVIVLVVSGSSAECYDAVGRKDTVVAIALGVRVHNGLAINANSAIKLGSALTHCVAVNAESLIGKGGRSHYRHAGQTKTAVMHRDTVADQSAPQNTIGV